MADSNKNASLKNNLVCLFDSENTKIARIKAKTERKKALLENKVRLEEIHSNTPKEKVIKTSALICSIIVTSIIAIILLSTFLVFKVRCIDMHKILSIASTTLSIVLSIIAIIFTFNSGLNLENRFHDIEKLSGDIKQLTNSVNILSIKAESGGKDEDIMTDKGYNVPEYYENKIDKIQTPD